MIHLREFLGMENVEDTLRQYYLKKSKDNVGLPFTHLIGVGREFFANEEVNG
jgi:hypothetical protein